MRRAFYTDRLAAAWMAEHFGMIFQYGNFRPTSSTIAALNNTKPKSPAYIDPDSLHLLEPVVGDIVELDGIEYGIVIGIENNMAGIQFCDDGEGNTLHEISPKDCMRTIQRDGKPFFWPEFEA